MNVLSPQQSTVLLCKLCYLSQTENFETKNSLVLAFLSGELCALRDCFVVLHFI